MSGHSQILYCLQEKLTHFGLEVSVVYVILSLYVLIFFKSFLIYILTQSMSKNEARKMSNQSSLYVLNCFRYSGTKYLKRSDKKTISSVRV